MTETDSTNNYTSKLLRQSVIQDWTIVVAAHQTGGKGQRGKHWNSEAGKNLLMTVYRYWNLSEISQFAISAATATAVSDALKAIGLAPKIKWPNDIFVDGAKVCGLLIENHLNDRRIEHSIIGIGLNVNQQVFPEFPWTASSLSLQLDREFDIDEIMHSIRQFLEYRFSNPRDSIAQYNEDLLGRGNEIEFEAPDGILLGTLIGINDEGYLILRSKEEGELREISNGSITSIESIC